MKINLQAKNMELTPAIHDYVLERVTNLGKLLSKMEEKGGEVLVVFDVAKTTNHHKAGEIFRADCTITVDGNKFYSSSDKSDLYAAVDDVKENIFHEITRAKAKKQHLFRRGAQKVKDLMKGFTSFGKK
ncbi:MAG: ribosome-associated translation inhibitor RaiA [Minisyncoccia bacterium]